MSQPIKKISAGQVQCALWENEAVLNGRTVTMVKATVERRYKQGAEWKSSSSFGRNDIPLVVYCLQQAFAAMIERDGSTGGEADESR